MARKLRVQFEGAIYHVTARGVEEAQLKRRVYGCKARAVAARMLIKYCGMSQRDAATWLNAGSGAAVCQQQAVLRLALSADAELAGRVDGIETRLSGAVSVRRGLS